MAAASRCSAPEAEPEYPPRACSAIDDKQHLGQRSAVQDLRILSALKGWALSCALGSLSVACSGSSSGGISAREWLCSETTDCSCHAEVRSLGSDSASFNQVDECSDLGCCLLSQKSASDPDARCDCFQTSASCEAEARAQAGSVVVSQCPPPGESPNDGKMCIAEGQGCRWGLPGDCCSGTLCRPNAEGVQTCQTATSLDLALGKQCARVANSHDTHQFELLTPVLRTSFGELGVPGVMYAFEGVGENGCLNDLELTLTGSASSCQLRLTVKLQAGKLVVTRIDGMVQGCPGFMPDAATATQSYAFVSAANPAIELSFQGLACDGALIFESYCVAGTFDFHISKTTIDDVDFEDQHLTVRGVACSSEPKGDCPSP